MSRPQRHALVKRELCTGCAACAAICPLPNCIRMQADAEGFLHPAIDGDICTKCGLCRRTCPVDDHLSSGRSNAAGPLQVLAAWHLDEAVRHASSSGGIFSALATDILSRGGFVAGAAFDDNLVLKQTVTDCEEGLPRLRGSKYVQSYFPPDLYRQIRRLLQQGRSVFFSGTPCQVAGLRGFLGEPYQNLLCCDLLCHGTPSPLLWERYIEHQSREGERLVRISFRDKVRGWKNFSVRYYTASGESRCIPLLEDPYMLAFLRNYSLRPSCYECQFASAQRPGDLTLADFWGVTRKYPEYDREDKGTSLILVNTVSGRQWLDRCATAIFRGPADLEAAIEGNHVLARPSPRPKERDTFYLDLETLTFPALMRKYRLHPPSMIRRLLRAVKRRVLWRR